MCIKGSRIPSFPEALSRHHALAKKRVELTDHHYTMNRVSIIVHVQYSNMAAQEGLP